MMAKMIYTLLLLTSLPEVISGVLASASCF